MSNALVKHGSPGFKGRLNEAKTTAIGFAQGFACLFKGLRCVYIEHRELARFYVPPMIFSFLFLIAGWILFATYAGRMVAYIWSEPDPEAWWGILSFLWQAVSVLLWIILAIGAAVLTAILFTVFAAPFSDLISERVEGILGTWEPRPFSVKFLIADLGQTLRFELTRAGIKLAWLAPLFLLSLLVPVVGQALYIGLGGYLLSKFTGMDYIDWCAARRGWTWKERFAFAKRHRFALAGFGSAVLLSLMIPLAFVIVWPAAVAGGAILFTSIHKA
ncbi:MAG: EI24 domain-containing protein [Myxococcota bacterium]|nr:EI24 domain-containing protein [Myxococcota bacterium]